MRLQMALKALVDVPGTSYCLKLDVKKFYPSIDHEVLKVAKKKDKRCRSPLAPWMKSLRARPVCRSAIISVNTWQIFSHLF
jgi:hypothetical protein